jgi:hypothetical protein
MEQAARVCQHSEVVAAKEKGNRSRSAVVTATAASSSSTHNFCCCANACEATCDQSPKVCGLTAHGMVDQVVNEIFSHGLCVIGIGLAAAPR